MGPVPITRWTERVGKGIPTIESFTTRRDTTKRVAALTHPRQVQVFVDKGCR